MFLYYFKPILPGFTLSLEAEEQRKCLSCSNKEDTSANDHHDLLLDILLLVVHRDVHADCADYGNYASNCITQFDYVRDVLRNLLRYSGKCISSGSVVTRCVLGEGCCGAAKEHESSHLHAVGLEEVLCEHFDFLHFVS